MITTGWAVIEWVIWAATGIPLHMIEVEVEGEGDTRQVETRGAMVEVADMTAPPRYIGRKEAGIGTGNHPGRSAESCLDTNPEDGRHLQPTMTIGGG